MKLNTLKKHKEFVAVASLGAKKHSKNFIVFCSDNICCSKSYSVGFTASKKIGNSVQRNRAKRRMRVLMTQFLTDHDEVINNHLNIVVIAKTNMISEKWDLLVQDFNKTISSVIFYHSLSSKDQSENIKEVL